jgi:hypothetical protein
MLSVRKEWKKCKSDEELLEWTKKWGSLLMETFQNPIFTAGHTRGREEIIEMLDAIRSGEYPDKELPEAVEAYADALTFLAQSPRVLSFVLKGSKELTQNLDVVKIREIAATEMAKKLSQFIEINEQEVGGETHYTFDLVMLE